MALREGYLKLGGLTLHHTYGGLGRPILFIHGLGSSGYIEWRFNLERFARGNRVFAPDLPGYGKSDKPRAARYGIPYFARTIDRYLESRRIREATVVGTSMGGRIALELALNYPGRVSRLVIVNSLGLGRPKIQPYYPMMLVPRVGETLLHGMKHGLRWAPSPVIRRFAALLDPRLVGMPLVAHVDVMLEHPRFERAFLDEIENLLEVQECYAISGDYGYRLKLRARDVEQFETLLREKIQTLRGVARTRVDLSLSIKKDSTLLPLAEGA